MWWQRAPRAWLLMSLLAGALASPAPAPVPAPPPSPIPAQEQSQAEISPEKRLLSVSVDIPTGGSVTGRSLLGVESFNAIPYADPPIGPLRLKPPRRYSGKLGTVDGTGIAAACPQALVSSQERDAVSTVLNTLLQIPILQEVQGREDCLTVNVQRPAGVKAGDNLPVLFWIYGGAFEFGSTNTYDATSLLATAVAQNQPFIFVAVNYRVAGFGFLGGKEIHRDGSANLGLLDQRMGLEWVADNIAAFGGDPSKVTIWGESAGAISVLDQMLLYSGNATYKAKPLFRGAMMNSGTVVPADPVDCSKAQAVYDIVVDKAGCSASPDTLECLRQVDYDTFLNAVNTPSTALSYSSVALNYLPRPDGVVLPASPDKLIQDRCFHQVPVIVGDQEDEGTLFSILVNLTTVDDMTDYLSSLYFLKAPWDKLKQYVELYEPALTDGSPFRTSIFNELFPDFKRAAAVLGDLVFTLSRRLTLQYLTQLAPEMPIWSYMSSYYYGTPIMGTFHASDILQIFYGAPPNNAMNSCRTYYFNFLYNLDPNVGVSGYANWPQWKEAQQLMWFKSPLANDYLTDDFRKEAYDFIAANKDVLYI